MLSNYNNDSNEGRTALGLARLGLGSAVAGLGLGLGLGLLYKIQALRLTYA